MPATNYLPDALETTEAERLATGFIFTEGPLWHPEGYWYFVDIRQNKLFRLTPGKEPEVVGSVTGKYPRLRSPRFNRTVLLSGTCRLRQM
jgi:sugar lactone lactonase YvrE